MGRKFTIITDQQPLKNLTDQVIQTPDQQRWLSKLIGYDFEIVYRLGKLNAAANSLSRMPSSQFLALSHVSYAIIDQLRQLNQTDPELLSLQQQLPSGFTFAAGLLLFRGRLVVPSASPICQQLLIEFHSSSVGGHAGTTRTFHRLSSNFYWKSMRKDVCNFVRECQVCQQMKVSSLLPGGLLQPLSIPNMVFEAISLDFIVGLPASKGKSVILVVVDRLSKYGHFIGLPANFSSVSVAAIFVKEIVRLHGIPSEIVSDWDARFVCDFGGKFTGCRVLLYV